MTATSSATASLSGATVTVTVCAVLQRGAPAGMKVSAPDTDTSVPDGTDGVTVTAAVGCVASTTSYVAVTFASVSVTATVVVATPSTVTVMPRSSSSSIVTSVPPTRPERPRLEVPVTATVSPSPSSTSSSSGARVKVAVAVAPSSGIVRVNVAGDAVKSVPDVAVPGPTDTVTVVASDSGTPSIVTVTATGCAPSPSFTDPGATDSVMRKSSSAILASAPVTDRSATVVAPVTRNVSTPSLTSSWIGVRVNVAVALGVFSGIVSVNVVGDAVKSVPAVAVSDSTDTVTGVSSSRVPSSRVPVTTMGVPTGSPSFTDPGASESSTRVDGRSSSTTDTATAGASRPS